MDTLFESRKLFYVVLLPLVLLLACKGPKGDQGLTGPHGEMGTQGSFDKQIRLNVGAPVGIDLIPIDTLWHNGDTLYHTMSRFNKAYYVNVDSVIFETLAGSFTDTTTCFVRLFNLTDRIPIDSSVVSVDGPGFKFVHTGNIFKYLPEKEIILGIQVRTNNIGREIYSNQFALYLYRK
jgi:hypothetical protein